MSIMGVPSGKLDEDCGHAQPAPGHPKRLVPLEPVTHETSSISKHQQADRH